MTKSPWYTAFSKRKRPLLSKCWHIHAGFTILIVLDGRNKNGAVGKKRKKISTLSSQWGVSCTLQSVYFIIHLHNEIINFCYITDLVFFFSFFFLLTSSKLCLFPHHRKDTHKSRDCLRSTDDIEGDRAWTQTPNCNLLHPIRLRGILTADCRNVKASG